MPIFVNINTVTDLSVLLLSFSEDDLIKYDAESRHQVVTELQALCLRFQVRMPLYLIHAADKDEVYDQQARLRGITPRPLLDIVNDDFDTSFRSLEDFRRWLAAQATGARFVNAEQDADQG